MHRLVIYLFLIVLIGISACARLDPSIRKSSAGQFAAQSGFSTVQLESTKFSIWSAAKGLEKNAQNVVIYIEGDGLAYKRRHRPSSDPTPIDYFTLQLASKDSASSVVYLARPCQYLSKQELSLCEQKYWTSHRYSTEVVATYEEIFDGLKQRYSIKNFTLVGYSGGGNIAAHLAARRGDISKLITIAANLDLNTWTAHHGLSPMTHSLNPASNFELKKVQQIHFAGAKDKIIPPLVAQAYMEKLNNPESAELIIQPQFDHRCCWLEQWHGAEALFAD